MVRVLKGTVQAALMKLTLAFWSVFKRISQGHLHFQLSLRISHREKHNNCDLNCLTKAFI